ncbi:MAG: hypothetical protein R3E77_02405 [Steroidobacteraceae bacterium]
MNDTLRIPADLAIARPFVGGSRCFVVALVGSALLCACDKNKSGIVQGTDEPETQVVDSDLTGAEQQTLLFSLPGKHLWKTRTSADSTAIAYLFADTKGASLRIVTPDRGVVFSAEYDGIITFQDLGNGRSWQGRQYGDETSDVVVLGTDRLSSGEWLVLESLNVSSHASGWSFFTYGKGKWKHAFNGAVQETQSYIGSVLSENGKGFAYSVRSDSGQLVVVNGVAGKEYDAVASLTLSNDGKRSAYSAQHDGKLVAVVDGKEGPSVEALSAFNFSPQGRHVAYVARIGGAMRMVLDQVPEAAAYDAFQKDGMHFSRDDSHYYYLAQKGSEWIPVVDGKPLDRYASARAMIMSPDGQHVAFYAMADRTWKLIRDSAEEGAYVLIGPGPVYSPDSQRWVAALGSNPSKLQALVDGKPGMEYDGVASAAFSPDSRHVAYKAQKGSKEVVVLDGKESAEYQHISSMPLLFSPAGKHLVYIASSDDKWRVVIDNKDCRSYENLGTAPVFLANGSVAYIVHTTDSVFLVTVT